MSTNRKWIENFILMLLSIMQSRTPIEESLLVTKHGFSVKAIIDAGRKFHKYGSKKLANGNHILTPIPLCTRIHKPKPTTDDVKVIIGTFRNDTVINIDKFNDIIKALHVVGLNTLALELEECIKS